MSLITVRIPGRIATGHCKRKCQGKNGILEYIIRENTFASDE